MNSLNNPEIRPTLLILSDRPENHRLLFELFESVYKIVGADDLVASRSFDIGVVEATCMARFENLLQGAKRRNPDVYLPILGLTSANESTDLFYSKFDDVISIPSTKIELSRRVKNLLKARELSQANQELLGRLRGEVTNLESENVKLQNSEQSAIKNSIALSFSNERLASVLEIAKIGFFDWDIKTDRVYYSQRMREDWLVKNGMQIAHAVLKIHPEDRAAVQFSIERAILNRNSFTEIYRIVPIEGITIWIEAAGEVEYDHDGRPNRFYGTSLNVTDRILSRQQLEIAKTEAENANQTKSYFLANMSHEIRTPLAAILGFTDLLREDKLSSAERQQFLETISRNGVALTHIIDDILDLAKVESGKLDVETIEFSLYTLIDDIMTLFRERARGKNIFLRSNFAADVPNQIISDPTRLRQILINIVGNAVKFTTQGGITIDLQLAAQSPSGQRMEIHVRDTGIGITEEQSERLFQPFVQADNSTSRKYGGTGLGLVLSKRLAQALGGDIKILSNDQGPGADFRIDFKFEMPAAPKFFVKSAAVKESILSSCQQTLENVSILIADDSKDNQFLITRMLNHSGAKIRIANNGVEAVQLGLSENFDIILMDIQMPEMDGYDATKALRAAGYVKPIIALTAHAMSEEKARTLEAGCSAHLTKPLNKRELLSTIEEFLGRK